MGAFQANGRYARWALVGSKGLPSNDNQSLIAQVSHGNGVAVGQLMPAGKVNLPQQLSQWGVLGQVCKPATCAADNRYPVQTLALCPGL